MRTHQRFALLVVCGSSLALVARAVVSGRVGGVPLEATVLLVAGVLSLVGAIGFGVSALANARARALERTE